MSAEAPGILSTELMTFLFMAGWSHIRLYVQPLKVHLISDIAILNGLVLYKHLIKLSSGAK